LLLSTKYRLWVHGALLGFVLMNSCGSKSSSFNETYWFEQLTIHPVGVDLDKGITDRIIQLENKKIPSPDDIIKELSLGTANLPQHLRLVYLKKWTHELCGAHSFPFWIIDENGNILLRKSADDINIINDNTGLSVESRYESSIPTIIRFRFVGGIFEQGLPVLLAKDDIETLRDSFLSSYSQKLGDGVKCVLFAYIGSISKNNSSYYVFNTKVVTLGNLSPRGSNSIAIFNKDREIVQEINRTNFDNDPMYCRDGITFLFGRTSQIPRITGGIKHNGNAIKFSDDMKQYDFYDIKEYGSSGGIDDEVPTNEQRENEIKHANDK
jgi:hypothetical protein